MQKQIVQPPTPPQSSFTLASLEPEKRKLLELWKVRDYPVLHPRGTGKKCDELAFLPPEKLTELFQHEEDEEGRFVDAGNAVA